MNSDPPDASRFGELRFLGSARRRAPFLVLLLVLSALAMTLFFVPRSVSSAAADLTSSSSPPPSEAGYQLFVKAPENWSCVQWQYLDRANGPIGARNAEPPGPANTEIVFHDPILAIPGERLFFLVTDGQINDGYCNGNAHTAPYTTAPTNGLELHVVIPG